MQSMRVHEQERPAHQASLRAEEVLHISDGQMRKVERKVKEATHRAEELKWRIEVGGIRPRSLPSTRRGEYRHEEGEDDHHGQEETD
jgi:hypothetical protein